MKLLKLENTRTLWGLGASRDFIRTKSPNTPMLESLDLDLKKKK